ncbi:MAG TPA: hypothetical protein VD704_03035 [Gaiellaceae bacterium]|nr:hypothetical protein [Gaiellaceae bacterium]
MADRVTLSIPHASPFHGVARLVVGGLAARLDLSYEHLEDLQLALHTVLTRDGYVAGDEVTVHLDVEDGLVDMAVEPLDGPRLRADLERETEQGIPLARLLSGLVDEVEVEDGGSGPARLRFRKRIPRAREGA